MLIRTWKNCVLFVIWLNELDIILICLILFVVLSTSFVLLSSFWSLSCAFLHSFSCLSNFFCSLFLFLFFSLFEDFPFSLFYYNNPCLHLLLFFYPSSFVLISASPFSFVLAQPIVSCSQLEWVTMNSYLIKESWLFLSFLAMPLSPLIDLGIGWVLTWCLAKCEDQLGTMLHHHCRC